MRIAILIPLLLLAAPVLADHPTKKPARQAVLLDGLGSVHHPVSTKNADAQKFFDQGLRLMYAFNHDEAYLSFARAAELDPGLAMARWGMALAVGPNYNLDADEDQLKRAVIDIQKAVTLAEKAPAHEQAYVNALAKRYSADPKADKKKLASDYAAAMRQLHRQYPDDLDAATLFAESLMNLRPWELWSADGKPAADTPEIVATLEMVLQRNPHHTGANHYYIHAIEASPNPERGLPAADRLGKIAPGAGHLVHMPSHIYARVGDHAASARANQEAALVDMRYIEKFQVRGVYPMMYYSHNLHFLATAHAMQGRYADAKKAADQLTAHVGPHVGDMPMLEFFLPTSTLVLVRFQRWDDILALPAAGPKQPLVKFIGHFGRGSAFAAKGNVKDAEKELAALEEALSKVTDEQMFSDRNRAKAVLTIPACWLRGRVAVAKKDHEKAVGWLEKAVAAEDVLSYIEPSDWPLPSRELLGSMLLRQKRAADAEKIFRADLLKNPRNPRSLYGLSESLKAQGKSYAAELVEQEFRAAWRNADVKISLD